MPRIIFSMDVEFRLQPSDKCQAYAYLCYAMGLSGLLSLALRSIYGVRQPMMIRCFGTEWESKLVPTLSSAAKRWRASLPPHRKLHQAPKRTT